jgi:hypothetical protein
LAGWKRHKHHPDPRIRRRFQWEARELGDSFAALVGASRRYFDQQPALRAKMSSLLAELYQEFGWKARVYSFLGGRWLLGRIRREEKRLAAGWTYEPPTFYERNAAVTDNAAAPLCQCTQPAEMLVGAATP